MTSENITIKINTANDAFGITPASEVARILRDLAKAFEQDGEPARKLYDLNGNVCGSCVVKLAR